MSLAGYDPLIHFSQTLCMPPNSRLHMFGFFLDESGTHADSSNAVVGGYLATIENWQHAQSEWDVLRKDAGVEVLHRADMENFQDKFADWDRKKLVRVLQEGHRIIKKYTEKAIGAAVITSDFEVAMPEVVQRAFGGPYGWCVHDCMVGIGHWAVDANQADPVRYVFERGARGRHQVERMLASLDEDPKYRMMLRIAGWSFEPKIEFLQLQPADWFAYEVYKHMDNRVVFGPQRAIRKSALDLFRPDVDSAHYWDAARIRKWVASAQPVVKLLEDRERALHSIGRSNLI